MTGTHIAFYRADIAVVDV